MEIIDEIECPNCKKIIQTIQIRRPYILMKGSRFKTIKGVYRIRIK